MEFCPKCRKSWSKCIMPVGRGSNMTRTEKYLHIFFQVQAWIFIAHSISMNNLIGASIKIVLFSFFPIALLIIEKFYLRKKVAWWAIFLFALMHMIVFWLFTIFPSYILFIGENSFAGGPHYKSYYDYLTTKYTTTHVILTSVLILFYPFVNLYSALLRFQKRKGN